MKNLKRLSRSLVLSFVVGFSFFVSAASARQVPQAPSPVNNPQPAPPVQPSMQKELAVLFVEDSSYYDQDLKLMYYDPQTGLTQENTLVTLTTPQTSGPSIRIRKTDMVISRNNDIDIVYLVQGGCSGGWCSSAIFRLFHILIPQNNFAARVGPVQIQVPGTGLPFAPWLGDYDLDIDAVSGEVHLAISSELNTNSLVSMFLLKKAAGLSIFTMTNPYNYIGSTGGGVEIAHNNTTGNIHISYNPSTAINFNGGFQEIIIDQFNNVSGPQQINSGIPVGLQFFALSLGKAYNLKPSVALFCQRVANSGLCQGIYVNKHQNFTNPQLGWDASPVLVSPTGTAADFVTIAPDTTPGAGLLAVIEGNLRRAVNFYVSSDFVNWTPSLVATKLTGNYVEVSMPKVLNPNNATNGQYLVAVATRYNDVNSYPSATNKIDIHIMTSLGWRSTTIKDNPNSAWGQTSCIHAEWLKI